MARYDLRLYVECDSRGDGDFDYIQVGDVIEYDGKRWLVVREDEVRHNSPFDGRLYLIPADPVR